MEEKDEKSRGTLKALAEGRWPGRWGPSPGLPLIADKNAGLSIGS